MQHLSFCAPIVFVKRLVPLAWINLAVEVEIVGTGGLVRLSGSGLGCPRWPECVSGSITPVSHRAQEWHKYIEFGNRMLTSVVSVVARLADPRDHRPPPCLGSWGAATARVRCARRHRAAGRRRRHLGAHRLQPLHRGGSLVLVATSSWLVWQIREHRLVPVRREIRLLGAGTAAIAAVILVLGTAVTGAGPHSGDAADPARFGFSP